MSRSSDYRLLLTRGRKAGLTASEINSALAGRAAAAGEQTPGQPDANGFMHGIDERGHMTTQPIDEAARE
ncbi:MAG: hypothetical protein K2W96_12980 [Gemmataceae bacterium]|nr:hypothetical protein [Gemmataceae bacterium]